MKLFTYGTLEHHGKHIAAATVPGQMKTNKRTSYRMARFNDKGGVVRGELIEVSDAQMAQYDKREAPDYKRRTVKTASGVAAQAYEYVGKEWA